MTVPCLGTVFVCLEVGKFLERHKLLFSLKLFFFPVFPQGRFFRGRKVLKVCQFSYEKAFFFRKLQGHHPYPTSGAGKVEKVSKAHCPGVAYRRAAEHPRTALSFCCSSNSKKTAFTVNENDNVIRISEFLHSLPAQGCCSCPSHPEVHSSFCSSTPRELHVEHLPRHVHPLLSV